MCKAWLGDSFSASKHIQSSQHSNNYNDFIMRNPHWEVDWLTERTKSYERNSEAKQQSQQLPGPANPPGPSSSRPLTIASLSDQLLAMIAANTKVQEAPPPAPPPPPLNATSSSSGDEESPERKLKNKKKKSKKKYSKDRRSSSREKLTPSDQIKFSYKSMTERKVDPIPVDDSFISEWMPRVEKRELVQLKKKSKDSTRKPKRMRKLSRESSDASCEDDKKASPSPYNENCNDHDDDAVMFNKRLAPANKDLKKEVNKKKYDEDMKYEKQSRHFRGDSREKFKLDDKYKNKSTEKYKYEKEDKVSKYDDNKETKEFKGFKEPNERNKKSPVGKMKQGMTKKKLKGKIDSKSDEDVHETSFEKRTSESAAKKKDGKKFVMTTLPKTKLPFIGRMPILKKKVEQKTDEKEEKKENIGDEEMKDVIPDILHPEGSVCESTTLNINEASNIDELPKSTLIISKRPRLAEPGIVKKEILFSKPANDNLTEQDMELDDDSGVKEEESAKDELHKDFKDALDLLFPEEKKKVEGEEEAVNAENETKLEEQPQVVAGSYMMPPGYEVGMYPTYYDQQAYAQQWAQMGYDQTGQYAGAYGYPQPMEQPSMELVQPQTIEVPPEEPKKKKNAPSQRMRRHLRKLKEQEALQNDDDEIKDIEGDVAVEAEDRDDELVLKEENLENSEDENRAGFSQKSELYNKPSDMSDLAMLGIDEDDAAAQDFC